MRSKFDGMTGTLCELTCLIQQGKKSVRCWALAVYEKEYLGEEPAPDFLEAYDPRPGTILAGRKWVRVERN